MPSDRNPNDPPSLVPPAKEGDAEDVSWALSTADAMWGRGDRADALKWVRRAADAASDADQDDRALEIAKAAADLAVVVEQSASMRPPPDTGSGPVVAGAPVSQERMATQQSPRGSSAPAAARDAAVHPSQIPVLSGGARKAEAPGSTLVSRGTEPRRPRKSAHNLDDAAKAGKESKKSTGRRSSRPPPPTEVAPPPTAARSSDEIDAWPTQALESDALSGLADEMTRIDSRAYSEVVKPPAPTPPPPGLRPSQAMRVIVWRSGDDVHVAPHGTTVSAITIDALLVAIDPGAELAAWLTKR